jgi:hypothetical protein
MYMITHKKNNIFLIYFQAKQALTILSNIQSKVIDVE